MNAIPVFYGAEMLAESGCRSPGPSKPKPLIESWQRTLPIEIKTIVPATQAEMSLAHDPAYVSALLACEIDNGFRTRSPEVAQAIPYIVGSLIGATDTALYSGVACALGSGGHHAHYDEARKFGSINSLCVAAIRLLRADRVRRALILDLDFHWADGTDDILERLGLEDEIVNASLGKYFCAPAQAFAYLKEVERIVSLFPAFDIILFHAGADLWIGDALGGVLNTREMRERDRIVFQAAKAARVPIAFALGGGYAEPLKRTLALHTRTMREAVRAYVRP